MSCRKHTDHENQKWFLAKNYLSDLDLKCGLWISEMRLVMLDGFVTAVETVSASVTVPVGTLEFF
jgi:hypothetical protein